MTKIIVKKPVVEIDGDEMARVMWKSIRDKLIIPFLDINLIRYDLSIENRNITNDEVTVEAAKSIKENNVGIKCATITPDDKRVREFNLSAKFPSPNGTIRNILNGTIFREPIICKNIPKLVNHWTKPVIIARHAFGDIYKSKDLRIKKAGKLFLEFIPEDGSKIKKKEIFNFKSKGIALGMFNIETSIRDFADSCFNFALEKKISLYFSSKNTILQNYDEKFKEIFDEIYKKKFKSEFQKNNLQYQHRLIDDMVACLMKWNGGYLWACKNYDGDVMSDLVAQGFGSLGLMTSVLQSPDGQITETEAAHGTVTSHYRQHQNGFETSTNPVASIFAWTRGLLQRARLDHNERLIKFSKTLENICIKNIESGKMTKDLALLVGPEQKWLTTNEFLNYISSELNQTLIN